MADEIVYRLLQGDGIQLTEDPTAKTVTVSVPGLEGKINVGDIVQATELLAGIAELATTAEVQAGIDLQRIVTPAGLAAAAQANAYDGAAGRLLKVGAFGLGAGMTSLASVDLNVDRPTGFYLLSAPVNGPGGDGFLIHTDSSVAGFAAQMFFSVASDSVYVRKQSSSTWSAWRSLWHPGNFDPNTKANTAGTYSGLSVGNSAQLNGQTDAMLAPPGMIASFAMASAPNGWLAANGAVVSRSTYAALFAAIGTTYGAGNGSTTFNLPDCRGMFARGWDGGRGIDTGRQIGTTQNSANLSHSHGGSSVPAGSHTHSGAADVVPDHIHSPLYLGGSSSDVGDPGPLVVTSPNQSNGQSQITNSQTAPGGAHAHSLTVNPVADHSHTINSDGTTEARPINIAFLTCIKA